MHFNPLQLPDTAENRGFTHRLLMQLCKNEKEVELDASLIEQLKRCIDYAYDKLEFKHRTLSNISKLLPMDFARWPAFRRWLCAHGKYPAGEYAYIFDNDSDQLSLHSMMGFDMTHFLDREPLQVRTAILMYLFHRIYLSLDGSRTSILLDEGWQYFSDPFWRAELERILPTLRKKNAHLVIATQSPSSIIQSPIRAQMLDNAATLIFFANPQAKKEEYIDGFKLTNSEFQAIASNAPESRIFLVKQEHDSTLCRLNLEKLPELLAVLSGNTKTVLLLDKIRAEVGDAPSAWLPIFYKRRLELQSTMEQAL